MSDTIRAIRDKYPDAYKDLSDEELTIAVGEKYPVYLGQDAEFKEDFESYSADLNEDDTTYGMIRNAWLRGLNQATTADVLMGETIGGKWTEEDRIEEMALANKRSQMLRGSQAYQEFAAAPEEEKIGRFFRDPFEITTQVVIESLAAQLSYGRMRVPAAVVAGAGAGSVVPGVGTVAGLGTGFVAGNVVTTLGLSYGSKFNEMLQGEGVDITNPDAIKTAMSDPDFVDRARNKSLKYGIPIAVIDAVTMKLGGMVATPGRKLMTESAGGATGEAAGQLVSEGEITSPSEVLIEGIAELGPGAAQQAGMSGINLLKDKTVQKDLKEAQAKSDAIRNDREKKVLGAFLEDMKKRQEEAAAQPTVDENQSIDVQDNLVIHNEGANAGEINQTGSVPNKVVTGLEGAKFSDFQEVIFTDSDDPHIAAVTGPGRLVVNVRRLKAHIKESGVDADEYISRLIQEESIHDAHLKSILGEWEASGSDLSFDEYAQQRFERITSEMTDAQKDYVRGVYGEDVTDAAMGAEFVRMLVQERRHGDITESVLWNELGMKPAPATRGYFRRAMDFMRRKFISPDIDPETIRADVENLSGVLSDMEARSNDMSDVELRRAEQAETVENVARQEQIELQRAEDAPTGVGMEQQAAVEEQRAKVQTDVGMEQQAAVEDRRAAAPPTDPQMVEQERREMSKAKPQTLEEVLSEPLEVTASELVTPSSEVVADRKAETVAEPEPDLDETNRIQKNIDDAQAAWKKTVEEFGVESNEAKAAYRVWMQANKEFGVFTSAYRAAQMEMGKPDPIETYDKRGKWTKPEPATQPEPTVETVAEPEPTTEPAAEPKLTEDEILFIQEAATKAANRSVFDQSKREDVAGDVALQTRTEIESQLRSGKITDRDKQLKRHATQIAASRVIDAGRTEQRRSVEQTATPDETGQTVIDREATEKTPEDIVRKREQLQRVAKAIDKLPPAQREVMQLTAQGLTVPEIMERTNKKRASVDTALSRARANLISEGLHLGASTKRPDKRVKWSSPEVRKARQILGEDASNEALVSEIDQQRLDKPKPSESDKAQLRSVLDEIGKLIQKSPDMPVETAVKQALDEMEPEATAKLDVETGVKTMDDVDKIFQPPETDKPTLGARLRGVIESFSTNFLTRFAPLKHLERKVFKLAGKKAPILDMARKFEQLAGSPARAEKIMMDFHKAVVKPIKGLTKEFNRLMFLRRTKSRLEYNQRKLDEFNEKIAEAEARTENTDEQIQELRNLRKEAAKHRKRVADWTLDDVNRLLKQLKAEVTPKQMEQLESAIDQYQEFMAAMLRMQVDSGRMSQETLNDIVASNDFYAPFVVLKHLEDSESTSATGERIDTTKQLTQMITGIDDTDFRLGDFIDAAYDKILTGYMLADKNLKMQELYELSKIDDTGLVRELKETKVGKKKTVREKADHEVSVFIDGEQKHLAVNKEVADAISGLNAQATGLLQKAMRLSSIPMKAGATSFNMAFQIVNLFAADIPRFAMMSKYGFRNPADLIRLPLDYVYSLFTSIAGNFGMPNALYKQFLESGAARSTLQRELTPELFRIKPTERDIKLTPMGMIRAVAQFASSIEETSKLTGLRRAMRIEKLAKMTPDQQREAMENIVTEVRNFAGSPDFGRTGAITKAANLNLVFMYFNARLQGVAADLGRLAGKDGGKKAALAQLRLGAAVGVPTVALWALNNSDEFKDDYEEIPDRDKENYWHIPTNQFFVNDEGKRVREYYRIPKREISKLYANVVESSMAFLETREPKRLKLMALTFLENILPVSVTGENMDERIESVVSSLNPIFKAPIELGLNRNTWLHRDIIPENLKARSPKNQYFKSTPQIFRTIAKEMPEALPESFRSPLMLKQLTGTMTAGLFTQFMPPRETGRKPLGVFSDQSPLFRRFIRSPYVNESETEKQLEAIERTEADRQFEEREAVDQFIEDTKGMSSMNRMIRARQASGGSRTLFQKYKKAIEDDSNLTTRMDKRVRGLGVSSGARSMFIMQQMEDMTYTGKIEYLRGLYRKKVVTRDVAAQIFRQTGISPADYAR